jgi:methylamine dehydrogenase accessory protein MauD
MTTILAVIVAVLVIVDIALILLVLGLAREIGRIQVRLGPLGARVMDSGPEIGEKAPAFDGLIDQYDRGVTVAGIRPRPQLLMFTGPKCSTCKALLPGIKALAKSEKNLDVVLVSDGTPEEHAEFLASADLAAKGLCNNMSHVESLLNALETSTPTVQNLYSDLASARSADRAAG